MKKEFRLLSNDDFSKTIKTGFAYKNQAYIVHYLKNNLNKTRIGIAASTKLGNAVIRTTTRRKIRAICDAIVTDWKIGYDIVIIPRNNFLDNDYQNNLKLLEELFLKFFGK